MTCVLQDDGTMKVSDEYGDWLSNVTFTKEAEEESLDAFAGTWSYSSGAFAFDGNGSVTVTGAYAGGPYTYEVSADGKTATFYHGGYYETMTCVLQNDGTMKVSDEYGEWLSNVTFTKEA